MSAAASTSASAQPSAAASATPAPASSSTTPAESSSSVAPAKYKYKWEAGEVGRMTLFPIKNPGVWEFRKLIERLHWTVEEVDMSNDKKDWDTRLNDGDRHFVRYNLGLFAIFDNLVIKNLAENFTKRFKCMEAEAYLAAQENQEWVHAEGYMLQAEGVLSGDELKKVLASVEMPAVRAVIAWASKYLDPSIPDGEALVAWAMVEGAIFSGAFCGIQWLRERNVLPGITEFNQFIARDEGVHCLFTCYVGSEELLVRAPRNRAHAIAKEAFDVAALFVDESLPSPLAGMTAPLMKQYVQFQIDCVLAEMRYKSLFRAKNPFPFMDKLSLNEIAKANFFERRVTAYQGATENSAVYEVDTTEVEY